MTILSWFENCTKEEIPPEYMWEDSDGLEQWWAAVKEKRESGFANPHEKRDDSDVEWEDSETPKRDQGPETAENDLARILKNG